MRQQLCASRFGKHNLRVNPYSDVVKDQYVREIDSLGIDVQLSRRVLGSSRIFEAASQSFPDATKDGLFFATLWLAYLIINDDLFDLVFNDESERFLRGQNDRELLKARLVNVAASQFSTTSLAVFSEKLVLLDSAMDWERKFVRHDIPVSLDSYLTLRRYYSTLDLHFFLARQINNPKSLNVQLDSVLHEMILEACARCAIFANDFYSWDVEKSNQKSLNAVSLLLGSVQDEDSALNKLEQLINEAVNDLDVLGDLCVSKFGNRDILNIYFPTVHAALYWPTLTDRYAANDMSEWSD